MARCQLMQEPAELGVTLAAVAAGRGGLTPAARVYFCSKESRDDYLATEAGGAPVAAATN